MINEGRCPVSAEELRIAVVCPVRLQELLEQLETAGSKVEEHVNVLTVTVMCVCVCVKWVIV